MLALASVLALASASQVLAHGGVLSYSIAGKWYAGWQPYDTPTGQTSIQRPWSSYNPIQGATSATMSCNDDGTSGALQLSATVAAGTPITAYWNQVWPHAIGPMITYMAACGGSTCTGVNSDSLNWFKIDQAGLLSGTAATGSWADGEMINNNSSWTSTIPSCIPAGPYLIRFETIALHSLPAQFYPECAQLIVTGGGSTTGGPTVKFPGGYSDTDPGIDLDVYSTAAQTQTTYQIPGPALFTCSGGGGGSPTTTSKPAGTTSAAPTTTAKASTTTTKATTTTTAAAGTVTHYGQCGGTGWTGGTVCVAPYTCQASSAYYSQCL